METKTCRNCLESKPLTDFYEHPKMSDGHLNKCKECVRRRVAKHRLDNVDRIREYDRLRSKKKERKEQASRYNKKYPLQQKRACLMLYRAVKAGKIHKKPCVVCGSLKNIHAHHHDYNKPLSIIWLCCEHHSKVHTQKEFRKEIEGCFSNITTVETQ